MMKTTINSFMNKLIDYAGLFPPAKLSLPDAVNEYTKHRKSDYNWIISQFIIPASLLAELREKYLHNLEGETSKFSVLVNLDNNNFHSLRNDLESISKFALNKAIQVKSIECKFPEKILKQSDERKKEYFNKIVENVDAFAPNPINIAFEAPFTENWHDNFYELSKLLEGDGNKKSQNYRIGSVKIRTGGIKSSFFPTYQQLSKIIMFLIDANVPFKATAGLHHPYRHYNETMKVMVHGFINVFGAAILGKHHNLKQGQLEEIIKDTTPKNFQFTENNFRWKEYEMQKDKVHANRINFANSFGSCSFSEPITDLKALNYL